MSYGENERLAFISNIFMGAIPKLAPAIPLRRFLRFLEAEFRNRNALLYLDSKGSVLAAGGQRVPPTTRKILYIADIDIPKEEKWATLLFNFSDCDSPDPALLDILSRNIRTAGKTSSEGVSYSAHLVMELDPVAASTEQHRAVLEKVPHLGRSALTVLMNRILRRVSEAQPDLFVYEDPETSKKAHFRPTVTFEPQPSTTLRQDVADGVVSYIELVDRWVKNPHFDEAGYTEIKTRTLKLKPTRNARGAAVLGWIDSIRKKAHAEGYGQMQVRYRKGGDDDREQLAPISTAIADAADAVYSRLEVMSDFPDPLAQCVDAIDKKIKAKMLALIKDNKLWT